MSLNLAKPHDIYFIDFPPNRELSLSTYFPRGTQYFYGYPAGEDSGFLNSVPPSVEELVAARPLSCAGQHVSVISFAATNSPIINKKLISKFSIPTVDSDQLIILPASIDSSLKGRQRNKVIMQSLIKASFDKNLVMAQPFADDDISDCYQIPSKLIRWLNDKSVMNQYIPANFLPERLATYPTGQSFAWSKTAIELPCVVKAASSSAGDGVFICHTSQDMKVAKHKLKSLNNVIIVEAYVQAQSNFGVHFGIPQNPSQPIDIIGFNEQLTTPQGEFVGGLITKHRPPVGLEPAINYLQQNVLPAIRDMGWYGVGCFDVLLDAHNRAFFIDSNFRMTGMSAYHFLVANHQLKTPILGFSGKFRGSQKDLLEKLAPLAEKSSNQRIMQMIALNRKGKVWNFNAALMFENSTQLSSRIELLLQNGVQSVALENVQQLSID